MLDIRLPMLSFTVVVVHVGRGRFHDDKEAGLIEAWKTQSRMDRLWWEESKTVC